MAIKILNEDVSWRNVIREVEILKKLDKVENIPHFVDYVKDPITNTKMIVKTANIFLIFLKKKIKFIVFRVC